MDSTRTRRSIVVALAFALTLVVAQAAAPIAPDRPPALASLPFTIDGLAGITAPPLEPEIAAGLAADQYVRRYYRGDGRDIEMDIAYYGQPKVGANMHSPLNCLPGNGWKVTHASERLVSTAIGPATIQELVVELGQTKYALSYWFQSRYRIVPGELSARLHLLGDAIRRRPADAGLVRVMTPFTGSGEPERDALAAFAARLIPEIDVRVR